MDEADEFDSGLSRDEQLRLVVEEAHYALEAALSLPGDPDMVRLRLCREYLRQGYELARLGEAGRGPARLGTAGHGMARRGEARPGVARHGEAWQGSINYETSKGNTEKRFSVLAEQTAAVGKKQG